MDHEESKSGLGEFWDNWIEEDKKEKKQIKELIEKRKQDAVKERLYDDRGKSKDV